MSKKYYSIGDASKFTEVNIETIRYYERIGLLPTPDRTAGGNRQYAPAHLKRIGFVKRGARSWLFHRTNQISAHHDGPAKTVLCSC